MINIAMRSQGAIDSSSLPSINTVTSDVVQAQTLDSLNTRQERLRSQTSPNTSSSQLHPRPHNGSTGPRTHPDPPAASRQPLPDVPAASGHGPSGSVSGQTHSGPAPMPLPALQHPVQKGQKIVLSSQTPLRTLKACLGWNTTNSQCDVDVSAFLLDGAGKVPGDDWFIFYGQTESPDHSTVFCQESSQDRESITIHLNQLNPSVKKIVFVLTIHEALEKKLHFGMLQDAYIRILNADSKEEAVSFKMTDYYTNVISMMIGEIYNHNGVWKFSAIGNGVAKDLSGLCELYGVQVSD
ncbi:MAG: TerD family protein [Lachnospiraceae bacterium]|nr:TerD family protein [Lachnospiraceae bacterium]